MSTSYRSKDPAEALREEESLDFSDLMEGLTDDTAELARVQVRLLKMDASYTAARIAATAVFWLALVLIGSVVALFLSLSLAWHLTDRFGSHVLGFGSVAGLYALLLMVFTLWWRSRGSERFILNRLNDLLHGK